MSDTSTPHTSATGGSAASQADSLERRAWTAHPWLSLSLRAAILIIPLLVGAAAVKIATGVVSRPDQSLWFVVWVGGLMALSTAAAYATQRLTRRLAPLSALFKMSLVFPDEAPSRFKTALRAGSGTILTRRVRESALQPDTSPEQQAAEQLVTLLARLNAHDRLTRGHSERVRAFSVMLGEEIGLSPDELDKLNWAALIHDIGKLEVPGEILNKPGRPDDDEWRVLRSHPGAAAVYVEPLRPWLGDWVDAATQHHERYDGGGYPGGLSGENISLAGRLVSIADAYDVMTAARSYKKPLPPAQARAELHRNAGTQFDPRLVRAFLQISLGRMRWVIGPMGWLAHAPELIRAPIATVASTSGGLVTAGAVTLAASTAVVTPVTETHDSVEPVADAAIERSVDDDTVESTPSADGAAEAPTAVAGSFASDRSEDDAGAADPSATPEDSRDEALDLVPRPGPTTSTTPGQTTTTTASPGAATTTTTAAPAPTTTAAPPPVSSTTTTTTTAPPPPPPPPPSLDWSMGSGGSTTSQSYLPLDGSLTGGPLPNYDTDRDSDIGLLVKKGAGIGETDPKKMQRWWGQLGGESTLQGVPRLDIWAATKDFDTNKSGRIEAAIYDCAANKSGCVLLASGAATFNQASFGADFGKVTITMTAIDTTLAPNRGLMLKVGVPTDSGDHLWFAYGTTTYPTELTIGS